MSKGNTMPSHVVALLFYLLLTVGVSADTNSSNTSFQDYIDEKQKIISQKVVDWSYSIDNGLSRWIYNADDKVYCDEQKKILDEYFFEENENSIDEFFKNEKFLDETEKRFVRVQFGAIFQSKESTEHMFKIRVQIPLSKTKKNIQLFIDNTEQDYFTDEASDNTKKAPDIGVSYSSLEYYGIKSKYSIVTNDLNVYIQARYSKAFKTSKWKIEPTQQFKYLIKDGWQEETNLYFDRTLEKSSLFRTTLNRRTRAHVDGMDYSLSFSYYRTAKRNTGLSLAQSFLGNTKFKTVDKPVSYSGISNYSTTVSWRQSIWRKWFIYEVQPAISFHRLYDYEPNYILRLNLEFYFGHI